MSYTNYWHVLIYIIAYRSFNRVSCLIIPLMHFVHICSPKGKVALSMHSSAVSLATHQWKVKI